MEIKKILICLAATLSAAVAGYAVEKPDILSDEMFSKKVAALVRQASSSRSNAKIAVLPFTYAGGGYSAEGAILADSQFNELSKRKNLVLVERENIDKLLDEKILTLGGFSAAKTAGDRFAAKVWSRGSAEIGESLKINFTVGKDCNVNIFSLGTSGKLTLLFPNRLHKNNAVKHGVVYSIPAPADNFKIKISGPKGVNKIMLFAATSDVTLLPRRKSASVFREVDSDDAARLRDLAVEIKNTADAAWGEAFCDVVIK